MSRVSEEKVEKLKAEMDKHVPNWEIVFKQDDKWPTWWLQALKWLFQAIGFIAPQVEKLLMEDFAQTVFHYILVPWSREEFDMQKEHIYSTMRHEYIHMRDFKRFHVLFVLSYILPPAFITFRAYWELRGYTQNMLVEYEEHGEVSDRTVDWIVDTFVGPNYLWMSVFRVIIRKRIEEIRRRIENEEIQGLYPNLKLLA